ncbi:tetratricopeptide repeat protein [Desulfovibrio sp. JC010]|uniref:tetratricopeptide repeat protein n=1 Tax=Desulfovibrio sp. JC010 TaxID=2593641 RepID=UPI0013CFA0C3|nr:tetratricopeptide repeat protein [Desulfovibrio sp. JC010]NDV26033.1 tetratricopeptide repeat protein [Desulfovibrio sp. JC010]
MRKYLIITLLLPALFFSLAGCKKNTQGQAFMQAGSYDKAVEYFESALQADPGNSQLLADLAKAKVFAAADHFASGQALEKQNNLGGALFEYGRAVELQPDNMDYARKYGQVSKKHSSIATKADEAVEMGRKNHDWVGALTSLQSLRPYAQTLPDLDDRISALKHEAAVYYDSQADAAIDKGSYQSAYDFSGQAMEMQPLPTYEQKNLALHHLLLSSQALQQRNYRKAYDEIQNGLNFVPDNQKLLAYKHKLESQWADLLYNESISAYNEGRLAKANAGLTQISRMKPGYLNVEEMLNEIRQTLAAEYYAEAMAIMDEGDKSKAGTVLANLLLVREQGLPQYWDIDEKIREAKKQLFQETELRVSFDVDNESAEPGASGYVKDRLLSRLKDSNLKNVRLLERATMDEILREQGLGQGFLDESTALQVKKIKGVQAGIKGSIIKVTAVESGREKPSYGSSKYISGTRMVPNPEYQKVQMELQQAQNAVMMAQSKVNNAQMGAAQAPMGGGLAGAMIALGSSMEVAGAQGQLNDAQADLAAAQNRMSNTPMQLQEEIESDYRYEIFDLTMEGEAVMSFRVIDYTTSEIGNVHTIRKTDIQTDRYIPGDPGKNVPTDPNDLPTKEGFKKELLGEAIDEAFLALREELSHHAIANYEAGKLAEERGLPDEAVESYIRFIYSAPDLGDPRVQHANRYIYDNIGLLVVKNGG